MMFSSKATRLNANAVTSLSHVGLGGGGGGGGPKLPNRSTSTSQRQVKAGHEVLEIEMINITPT